MRPRRVDPLERVLNLFTLLHRSTRPLTREQIVAEMARGMTPYPTTEDAQRQLFGSDKNTIVRDLGIQVRQTIAQGDEAGQTKYWIRFLEKNSKIMKPPLAQRHGTSWKPN